jgi:YidC/Oxa1 family membrane protein insertase
MTQIWNGIQQLFGGIISFFYDLVPNLGVAIILLTIVVGIFMFPLTLKQTRSMKAMQEIQPEVKRLQREFKDDRRALQEATMELYKERGVNPAAGCFPLLLQMPVWFALFSVLRQFGRTSIEDKLKWVSDGSDLARDITQGTELNFLWMDLTVTPSSVFEAGFVTLLPYLIAIAVVMGTAYWQQRQTMARSQENGQQQKQPGQGLMKIFPVFFGFISFQMPAGLVVYFAASQIFRIGQQALIIRLDERRAAAAPAKPAASPSKTEQTEESESPRPARGTSKPTPKTPPKGTSTGRPAPRRPQGSQKKRGKRRRRK